MESRFVSVDSFLQSLSAEGQLDSTGHFTVSIEHKRQKLHEFLLNSTEEYLLKLIQAGVAAGATELDLRSNSSRVRFTMVGADFAESDLVQILDHLLAPGEGAQARALQHLALAINTAVTTRATGILLATWNGREGRCIEWLPHQQHRISAWKPRRRDRPLLYFELRRTGWEFWNSLVHMLSQRDMLSMLLGTPAGLDADLLLVLERARWCPVPLRLNGRWLSRPGLGPEEDRAYTYGTRPRTVQAHWLEAPEQDPGLRHCDPQTGGWWAPYQDASPGGAVVAVGYQPTFDSVESQILWVYDGVTSSTRSLAGVPPGMFAWGVASAAGCRTDLTGLRVIDDELLARRGEPLRVKILELLGESGHSEEHRSGQ